MHELLRYPFDSSTLMRKRKSIRKELIGSNSQFLEKKIAILGGSTTHDIKEILDLFLLNYGIKAEFYESEYNKYWEDVMFDNPQLIEFKPDLIIIHTTIKNITSFPNIINSHEEVAELIQTEFSKYEKLWEKIADKFNCTVIQNNFEMPSYRILGNKDSYYESGKTHFVLELNRLFGEYALSHNGFYINDINYLSADFGLNRWSNSSQWLMYKYAISLEAIPTLSFNLANIIKSVYGKNKKALAIDLDNTLWGGIIGEDGYDGIEIGKETAKGEAFSEFQSYLKELQSIGIVLNIISKNDEDLAIKGLNHPNMVLKQEDFLIIHANWEPKNKNLLQTAKQLSLLPEAFVFVDDNPAEREIIKQTFPDAGIPELTTVDTYISQIDKSGFFECTTISTDDFKRNDMYKENLKREISMASFDNYDDYLRSLKMSAYIDRFSSVNSQRISQLTNKSNQFNLTTRRYTQEDILTFMRNDDVITLSGRLEDSFGDNGIVSLLIGKIIDNKVKIDLFLMSCRVLKRNMEHAMIDVLVEECRNHGIDCIEGEYIPTEKNSMVKQLYKDLGFTEIRTDEDGYSLWRLSDLSHYKKQNEVISIIRDAD